MDSLGNIWKHIYSGPKNRSAFWPSITVRYYKYSYLLTHMYANSASEMELRSIKESTIDGRQFQQHSGYTDCKKITQKITLYQRKDLTNFFDH